MHSLVAMEKAMVQSKKYVAVACDGGEVQIDNTMIPYIPYIMQHNTNGQPVKIDVPVRTMEIILACLKQAVPKIPQEYSANGVDALKVIPAQVREICKQEFYNITSGINDSLDEQIVVHDFIKATHFLGIALLTHIAAMHLTEKEYEVTSGNFSEDIIKLIQGGWKNTYADKYGIPDLVAYGIVPYNTVYLDLGYILYNNVRLLSRQIYSLAGIQVLTNLQRLYLESDFQDQSERFTPQNLDLISNFTNLIALNLAGRNLTDLPLKILNACTKLRSLNLGNNPLKNFKLKDITHLTALCTLKLHHTQIDSFDPQLLTHLPQLTQLDLRGNPVCHNNNELKEEICTIMMNGARIHFDSTI